MAKLARRRRDANMAPMPSLDMLQNLLKRSSGEAAEVALRSEIADRCSAISGTRTALRRLST